MRAAERAFAEEQRFMSQTFVAIARDGKDPCELRQAGGDPAVRALIESRVPLVEFVLRTTVGRFDLNLAEGRVAALDRGVPLVAMIKDHALRDEYARRLAGLVGVDEPNRVVARVRGLVRSGERAERAGPAAAPGAPTADGGVPARVSMTEREVIKAALQLPDAVGKQFDELGPNAFLVAVHQQLQAAIAAAGGATAAQAGPGWPAAVAEQLPPESQARHAVNGLAVEPLRAQPDRMAGYAAAMVASLANAVIEREIGQLKGLLQRADSNGERDEVERLHPRLIELELKQRELQQRAIGGEA
jgi:DNA primase